MKLCEHCGKNPITVKLIEVVDGKKKFLYLCESCARERGIQLLPSEAPSEESLAQESVEEALSTSLLQKCPRCGMTLERFRDTKLLGCPEDYTVFEYPLKEILERHHGRAEHRGKVPVHASPDLAVERQILRLKRQLQKAVEREEYEKAAKLRDQILELEGKNHGSGPVS